MNPNDFDIGQTVCVVVQKSRSVTVCDATVSAIGRKWVTLVAPSWYAPVRMDPETMRLDGRDTGYGPARVYVSRAAYETEAQLLTEWSALRTLVDERARPPSGITIDQVRAAHSALFTSK